MVVGGQGLCGFFPSVLFRLCRDKPCEVRGEYVMAKGMVCLDCWIKAVGFW